MGARREFVVDGAYAQGRLETFLRSHLGLPRTLALKAIRKGWVRLDGKRTKVDARLAPGARVVVTNPALALPGVEGGGTARPKPARRAVAPAEVERARASVRLSDDDLVVSSKPAGRVVHAGSGHEAGWVDAVAAAVGGDVVPIGRLDRDTSGLLLLSRHRAATRALFAGLRDGTAQREYVALAYGRLADDAGRIDLPLSKEREEDGLERMAPGEEGLAALTLYRVLERLPGATLVACRLVTGRTHQIRAHLAAIGHPVLGDPRYGTHEAASLARELGLARLFLHAGLLELVHPTGGRTVKLEDPLPPELAAALERLRARGG